MRWRSCARDRKGKHPADKAVVETPQHVRAVHSAWRRPSHCLVLAVLFLLLTMSVPPGHTTERTLENDLKSAAESGDTNTVNALIARGADVNEKNEDGMTALMKAVWNNHTETVQALLAQGADVNAKDADGETALMKAARLGTASTVVSLLAQGADVNAKDADGETALMKAAELGDPNPVIVMLDKGADVTLKGKNGQTALMRAAVNGHTDTVQVLLAHGADVNAKDSHGKTALTLAEEKGDTNTVNILLIAPILAAGDQAEKAGQRRQALAHYTAALRDMPFGGDEDQRLRQKIIKLAFSLNPPPAVPEEARRHAAYAMTAFRDAKPDDLGDAIKEWQETLRLAPWWAEAYYNLAATYEKKGNYDDAVDSLRLYLLAKPGTPDAEAVRQKIYSLEYEARKRGGATP